MNDNKKGSNISKIKRREKSQCDRAANKESWNYSIFKLSQFCPTIQYMFS